jgi:hypothetical protein
MWELLKYHSTYFDDINSLRAKPVIFAFPFYRDVFARKYAWYD